MNILIFCLISSSIQYTLVYNSDLRQDSDTTNLYCYDCGNINTTCNSIQTLGGQLILHNHRGMINVNVNLRPHYKIKVEILLAKLEDWKDNGLQIGLDGKFQLQTQSSQSSSQTQCNSLYYDEESIIFDIPHHKRSVAISIFMITYKLNLNWGVGKFNLYIQECPPGCQYCKDGDFTCQLKLAVTTLTDITIINNDGWQGQANSYYLVSIFKTSLQLFEDKMAFKTFELENHQFIKLKFQYYAFQESKIQMQIDSVYQQILYQSDVGWELYESDYIPHSQLFITIYIQSLTPSSDIYDEFYFRDFEIYTSKLDKYQVNLIEPECVLQIQDQCLKCSIGWYYDIIIQQCVPVCGDGLIRGDEQCDTGNKIMGNCVDCKYQCDQYCSICKFGICQQCQLGFQINKYSLVDKECQSICGDNIVSSKFEQCDDGNVQPYDGCYNCQYHCAQDCMICQNGQCLLQCDVGNLFLNGKCQSVCGDAIKTIDEQCDDGNIQPYDGCFNCQYQCIEGCNICEFGICILKCEVGYQFLNGECYNICGDAIKTVEEECDDGNTLPFDGCYNCQNQCIEGCSICEDGVCKLKCEEGYYFLNGECQSYCGDAIKTLDEECDDGNIQPYDGCFNCQYQCIKDCNICQNGKCLLKCDEGQIFKNNQCYGICGDGIKTKDEQCDDGNNESYDGCYNCKYQCPKRCIDCLFDICIYCEQFYEVDNNICVPIINCGNGKLDYKELCDDYNNEANDGCFKCQIEQDWICKQYDISLPSECSFLKQVEAQLTYLNITGNKQYVELSFSNEVKVKKYSNLSQTLNFDVIDVPQEKQVLNLIGQSEVIKQASQGLYIFEIEINEILSQMPYLQIDFGQTVYSSEDIEITQISTKIKLRLPNYLSQAQKQAAQNLAALNTIAIYSIAGFASLSLLFGVLEPLLEVISILSYQQYLRYINIQYPANLFIYFSINDLIDISPVLDFLRFDLIMRNMQVPQQFLQSKCKFKEYQLNGDLMTNLQAQILQIIFSLILALILSSKKTKLRLYNFIFTSRFFNYASTLAQYTRKDIVLKVCIGIFKLINLVLEIQKWISKEGLIQLFYINSWDLIFKAFLYLNSIRNLQELGFRSYISVILSILIILIYILLTLSFLTSNKTNGNQTGQVKNRNQDNFFGFSLMRQILFLFIIVFFQDQQNLQAIGISFINIFWAIGILYFRKIQSNISFYTNFIIEISIATFTLTSIIYLQDFSSFISMSQKIICGWIHIVLLSFGIQFYLIFSIFQVFMNYIKKRRLQQIGEQLSKQNNQVIFQI